MKFGASHAVIAAVCFVGGMAIVWSVDRQNDTALARENAALKDSVTASNLALAAMRADTVRITEQVATVHWREGRTDSLTDTLFLAVPDTLKPLVEDLAHRIEQERQAQDSLVALLRAQIAWRDSALDARTVLLERTQHLLDVALAKKARRCGLGVAGPFAATQKGVGWGAGGGVSCRL